MVTAMVFAATSKTLSDRQSWRVPAAWTRWGALGAVAMLLGVGVLLVSRRLAGALTTELPIAALMLTAVMAAAVTFGGRLVWPEPSLNRKRADAAMEGLIAWGGSAALVLAAIGCSFQVGRAWHWIIWLPIVALDQWQRQSFLRRERGVAKTGRANHGFMPKREIAASGAVELQRVVRQRDAEGVEAIWATMRAEFAAGQRSATLHVGFCPPLSELPRVEVATVDGPEAEVKVSQAFAHGARLELRLSEAAKQSCCVVIQLTAKPQAEFWNHR
jgi:hypothetical protein